MFWSIGKPFFDCVVAIGFKLVQCSCASQCCLAVFVLDESIYIVDDISADVVVCFDDGLILTDGDCVVVASGCCFVASHVGKMSVVICGQLYLV